MLCRSYHTVRTQKRAIYKKLGVTKDTELMAAMICEHKGLPFTLPMLREKGVLLRAGTPQQGVLIPSP